MATKKRATASRGKDAIAVLKSDHVKVRKLLGQLEKAEEPGRRQTLFGQIEQELAVHTQIEEEIFYPAYKDAAKKKDQRKLFFEAAEEHGVVKTYLPKMRGNAVGEVFGAQAKVLKDLVEHHAEEEETEMFPKARKLMSAAELRDLGRQLVERKKQLMK
jgi:hemerythrin superfamily protein